MEDNELAAFFLNNVDNGSSSSSASDMSGLFSSDERDTGSSDENEDNNDFLFPIFEILLNGRPRTRVLNFVETAMAKSDSEFREDFRVSREIFQFLLEQLEGSGFIPDHEYGKPKKSACLSLLMTLWFVGNQSAHRDLANLFNISFSSVHRILRRVLEWLVTLMREWIVWPQGNEVRRVSEMFQTKADIANCIGAIDGSHIPIIKPVVNGREYYNRKQGYSILLQGVVDCDLKFIHVYCGDPGSFHDVRLLRRSDLHYQAERNTPALFPRKTFLLGDKGYIGVGKKWIVTPFRDNDDLLPEQVDFNRRVSGTRVVVEQAFGILKARFRRLRKMELRDLEFMVHVVMACCVLHNVCLRFGDGGDDFDRDDDNEQNVDDNNGDDEEDEEDEAIPNDEVSRQLELFAQMYPNVALPRRGRRQRI